MPMNLVTWHAFNTKLPHISEIQRDFDRLQRFPHCKWLFVFVSLDPTTGKVRIGAPAVAFDEREFFNLPAVDNGHADATPPKCNFFSCNDAVRLVCFVFGMLSLGFLSVE